MKEISISEFRANYSRIFDQVRKSGRPIRVTRFGRPLAEIVPPSTQKRKLGCMVGTGRIVGDIVGPTGDLSDWDAAR